MRRYALAAVVVAACYSPKASPGAPCGPGGECPSNLECIAGTCLPPGTIVDLDAPGVPEDAAPDTIDAAPDAPPPSLWSTPVEVTSLETAGNGETDPTITTDRLTAIVAANTATNDDDLYIGTRATTADPFTSSLFTAVDAIGFNDKSPEISGDGKTLYFSSNRGGVNDDIYVSTFTTAWSTPALVTELSSTTANDKDIAVSPDGLTAAVVREGSPNRISIFKRSTTSSVWGTGVLHTELNVTTDIAAPSITNGGAIMYLHAGAPRDIYRAQLKGNGTYTVPVAVTELNTTAREAAPFIDQTETYMIFERAGDIFETMHAP